MPVDRDRLPGWLTHEERRLAEELVCFTTEQLLAELARRTRVMREHIVGVELCDGCAHQRFWMKRGDPPHDFNTCSLGHALEFKMPDEDDVHGDTAGFYRSGGCTDREDPPPPPQPPEPTPPPRGGRPASVE